MTNKQLVAIIAKLPGKTNIFIDSMNSPDANEILVETWSSGDIDAYITDDAQAHIDYCDTLSSCGLESLVIYKANGSVVKVK